MLDWLDDLPDMRIPGVQRVHGVQPQKTVGFTCTPPGVQRCAPVCMHTPAHPSTPPSVQPKPAENRHSTPCTPCTPPKWDRLTGKSAKVGEWARLLAIREAMPAPTAIEKDRWREVLTDAHVFLTRWGEQAVAMGWTAVDLFSVPSGPDRWVNRAGLIALLHGRPVVVMTDEAITIANMRGGSNRYRRSEKLGAVMLWSADAFSGAANSDHQG